MEPLSVDMQIRARTSNSYVIGGVCAPSSQLGHPVLIRSGLVRKCTPWKIWTLIETLAINWGQRKSDRFKKVTNENQKCWLSSIDLYGKLKTAFSLLYPRIWSRSVSRVSVVLLVYKLILTFQYHEQGHWSWALTLTFNYINPKATIIYSP